MDRKDFFGLVSGRQKQKEPSTIDLFKDYNRESFRYDLFGGISVAAISIPVGVAYAEIAGMPPESGLYTAIIALIAYFFLGGGRQVIIGPDSATVTLFATSVVAVTAGDHGSAPEIMMLISVTAGLLMFVAGFFRLGFLANFLSKPILLGYVNGISIWLIVSQLGKLTGIDLEHTGFFQKIIEVFQKISLIHYPTFILAVVSILFLYFVKKISIKIPSQLLLLIFTVIAAVALDLESFGIVFMQPIKDPYPSFTAPDPGLFLTHYPQIFAASAAVAFVSFSSEIPVVRAFTGNSKTFDANKEFFALGLADVLIGFFRGYPVSGADSRTAVNVAVGGRTKVVNLIAAALMLMVILFVPGVFAHIPLVTFGAIIFFAAVGMFKRGAGPDLFNTDRKEFLVFLACASGVLLFGVYQGILFALILSIIQLVAHASKPTEYEMVYDREIGSYIQYIPGTSGQSGDELLIYRFNSALVFFNCNYFSEKLASKAEQKRDLRHIVIDAEPINVIDLTAAGELGDLIKGYNENGVKIIFARANDAAKTSIVAELNSRSLNADIFYPSVHEAIEKLGS